MGPVVTKPIQDNQVMVGAPAETLEEAKKFKRIKTKIISEE